MLGSFIDQLKAYAERALGREEVKFINIEDAKKVPEDAFYFGNILESVQNESAEVVAEKRKVFLNTRIVKGQGEAAEKMRGLFADMIGPAPFDPADVVFNKITRNASKMTNRNIMRIAKMVMDGDLKDTILFKDVDRRMEVTIEGVGTLSTDFNKALDQIACFVTGKKDAKFKTLDDASKRKAAIVIGFLGQESDKAVVDGCAHALDPKGDTAAIVFGGRQDNDKKVYNLRLGKDGHLYMNLQLVEHREYLADKAGKMIRPKGGITIKAGIDYNIAPKEMNRLSELDLASYDDSGANEEFLAVGEKVMNENRIDKMYDKIPEDYKITARCVTYYDVDVQD